MGGGGVHVDRRPKEQLARYLLVADLNERKRSIQIKITNTRSLRGLEVSLLRPRVTSKYLLDETRIEQLSLKNQKINHSHNLIRDLSLEPFSSHSDPFQALYNRINKMREGTL